MAVEEKQMLMNQVDETGKRTILYPINRTEDVEGLEDVGVFPYSHSKSGSVHSLNGSGNGIRFVATAPFAAGDTIQVNGKAMAPKTWDGNPLDAGAWVTGAVVVCFPSGGSLFFRAGGGLNKSVIIATAPSGSTLTCTKDGVTKSAAEDNGTWTFRGLDLGTWTVKAVKGEQSSSKAVTISRLTVEYVSLTYFAAYINATWPAGSTCKITNGSTTITAPNTSGSYQFTVPNTGTWTVTASGGGDSDSQTVSITTQGQSVSVTLAYSNVPEFTYTGDYQLVDDNDDVISNPGAYKGNWKIRFLTSGTLRITKMRGFKGQIDVFCVGGGGNGGTGVNRAAGGGGGGGYTKTAKFVQLNLNVDYTITIGGATGATAAFGVTANGGGNGANDPNSYGGGAGGKGGSGGGGGGGEAVDYSTDGDGGKGGSDGKNGAAGERATDADGAGGKGGAGGTGQGTTTKEFGEPNCKLYSGGGGGGAGPDDKDPNNGVGGDGGGGDGGTSHGTAGKPGVANTGGGGGGGGKWNGAGKGGSGIVVIRNAR